VRPKIPSSDVALAELSRRSLRWFVRAAWPHAEPGVDFVDGWHVDAICEHLEALFHGDIKRLVINVPPRTCKSTISSVLFPAWTWLQRPNFSMLTTSYEYGLAVRDSGKARRLMDTAWYRRVNRLSEATTEPIFRLQDKKVRELARLKDAEGYYENDKGGYRIAVGTEGAILGKGAEMLCTDDPMKPDQALSEADRVRILRWFDHTLMSRFNDPKKAKLLVVMQRLHAFDITGHVIAQGIETVHLKLPMEYDPRKRCTTMLGLRPDGSEKVWADPRLSQGELLWPDRYGRPEVEDLKKRQGPWAFAAQQQQEPAPEGGTIVPHEKFKYWTQLPRLDMVAMSVDCAFTDAKTSSYVVIQSWAFAGTEAYLLHQVREHLDFVKTLDAIRQERARLVRCRMTPSAVLVENKANGPAVISSLLKEVPGLLPMDPRKMGGSKESRASSVAPFVHKGDVHLPEGTPWMSEFLLEMANFPNYSSDDQVDAMSQALWWRFLSGVDPEKWRKVERAKKWLPGSR
jgi:predicted phage terminase large subunit-like protein